jgi:hypothetical protein
MKQSICKMQTQRGSAIIILLVVLVVILAGALVYFGYFKKPGKVAVSPTPTLTVTKSPSPTAISDWKIYRNTEYGFQLTFTDAWVGYRVYKEQLINNSGASYIFAVPTKDKTFSDIGVPAGYFRAFILILLDKNAVKPWDETGPHPKFLKSGKTVNFYVSYPQEMPSDSAGKIYPEQIVNTLKLLP